MKIRLDQYLVENELAPTRSKAEALIRAGSVLVNDVQIDKPGAQIKESDVVRLKNKASSFVGRGGDKIDSMFDFFAINLVGRVAIDVGASTGGFTDCMLNRGCEKVYAVDVGYNQLDYKLRSDSRVVVMERTNAKDLKVELFDELPSFAAIDVSFIGLTKILESVVAVMADNFEMLALVKPQFELGPEHVEKGGVVSSRKKQLQAVSSVIDYSNQIGLSARGYAPSPLRGGKKGNQEYFLCLSKNAS